MTKVNVFCGISSLGMPFTKENKNHIGYFDILKSELSNLGYEVTGINISRLNNNRTWDLQNNLEQDKSMAYIKNLQVYSIEELRSVNPLFKLIVPKKYQESIKITEKDENCTLKSIYKNAENPIFLYSGGPNDFFTYIHAGPVELMDSEVRKKLPNDLEAVVDKCVDNIEQNWLLLREINPNVQIYALSYYYSPLYDKIQKVIYLQEKRKDKNKKEVNNFLNIIELFNLKLSNAAKKYEYVDFIDISFIKDYCAPMDFHPNTLGNQLIADEIMKTIKNKNFSLESMMHL